MAGPSTFPPPGDAKLVRDNRYGFLKVDPMPSEAAIAEFYEREYFAVMAATERAPDIAKLMVQDEKAKREREWLAHTVHGDVADAFRAHAPGRRVLDAGCGSGDLVAYLTAQGFQSQGFDPSRDAVDHGRARGLTIEQASITSFASRYRSSGGEFDGVSLMGVLDCVPDPASALRDLGMCLKPGGLIYLWVGNQFNLLQTAARDHLQLRSWWVIAPDHLNYFDRTSLLRLLDATGFDALDVMSDFPMEMFLLMGDNYRADPAAGAAAHARRVAFEMALPREARRTLYRGFAQQGIGRCIHVAASKRA